MTNDPPEDTPPPDRTVFHPAPGSAAPPSLSPSQEATTFSAAPLAGDSPRAGEWQTESPPVGATSPTASPRPIAIGDVLNHIFEVKRFIARGGMGEVFEGANVNSDERVAIKVMLPHLAADPNVQAMFRKEARTLTRLSHPALVQYRVLAQEPNLGVFYIVTEYIDGQNLSDIIKTLDATPADLKALLKKLAEGLSAAHALGAIHRDISPDNVMLEGGTLSGAKIIDFGIAKDLDPGSATIIGDGFAGKLNYVAPEQLGDFDRSVGPWTDVYSLALVILAVARRDDVEMGGTLVDAVDKRRAGPDISVIPAELRPVIEKMLKPNPADRARSMGEVIEMIAHPQAVAASVAASPPPPALAGERVSVLTPVPDSEPGWIKSHIPLVAGGGGLLAVLAALGIYLALPDGGPEVAAPDQTATEPAVAANPVEAARAALNAGLPSVACTWLDVANVADTGAGVSVVLRGVAGKPAEAQGQIAQLLAAKNVKVAGINFEDVSPIQATECAPLEAFRQIRDPAGGRLSVAQPQFEMSTLGDIGADAGKLGATAIVEVKTGSVAQATLYGLEESGNISEILPDRAAFDQEGIEKMPDGSFRIPLATTHKGWSGVLLLTGNGPFDPKLIGGPPGSRGADWTQRFLGKARAQNWKSEMVWYKTVDEQPN